ncbi:MAG: hypothetical protein ACOX4N_03065 [Dethiobacteraceae bacterium]|jgi:hypothetical protein|nr:hypothetical protein [Bacillota bacterium]
MSTCIICGSEVEPDDIYILNGKVICDCCDPVYANPSRPCCSGGPLGHKTQTAESVQL